MDKTLTPSPPYYPNGLPLWTTQMDYPKMDYPKKYCFR